MILRVPSAPLRPWAVLLTVGVSLCAAWLLGGWISQLPIGRVMASIAKALLVVNGVGLFAFLARAWASRLERSGWLLLAAGLAMGGISNGVSQGLTFNQQAPSAGDWWFLGLQVGAGLVQAAGVVVWPRSGRAATSPLLHVLGGLLFASSFILLFWLMGVWSQASADTSNQVRNLALAGRFALFGGAMAYVIGLDPRRLSGPIGWFLGSLLSLALLMGLIRPFLAADGFPTQASPWFGAALLGPLCLVFGALLGGPVLPGDRPVSPRFAPGEIVAYLPYLISGGMLGFLVVARQDPLAWPLIAFIGITGLLVLRQFLLIREVKQANQGLEDKVEARTRDLERLQRIMVATERMNAAATLGAGLAHDLNNLLGAIRNSAELIQLDVQEGRAPDAEDLERIQEAAAKAGGFTQRLMAFARREQVVGQRPSAPLGVSLRNLEPLLLMLVGSGIALRLEGLEGADGFSIDPGILEQILVNLVSNARDALQGRGTIWIRVAEGPQGGERSVVCLDVEDDGPGIPEDLRARVFEPFFTTKPEGKGTGLGLASVQALVEGLDGRLELVAGRGKGACFRVELIG